MRAIDGNGPTGSSTFPTNTLDITPEVQLKETTNNHNDMNHLRQEDLEKLWEWNKELPPLVQRCMHDIFLEVSQRQPDALAVSSWDGSLSYGDVEKLSGRLAYHLKSQGVAIGAKIPLCFEKSMWAVVALLGVMRAGATFSLTDPSQPEARLRTIVEQTEAETIVTSVSQRVLGQRISRNDRVIAVSRDFLDSLDDAPPRSLPLVPASTPMYIIFTSGSTGKPKGVVISHENYTSGALPRAEAVGYKSSSRVFDFPSYAFDVSIDCMLCTLACGGNICVPSEADRVNDLSGAIRKSKANMVHMTPSVARVLDSDIIPSLDVLGLGGEAVSASDAAEWSRTTNLVIAYGPSECTVGCTINNTVTISTGIGKGVGGTTWITDPEDHNVLMSVGEVGELLIEGPVVGIGYLGEPEKTAEVFIEDPVWLTAGYGKSQGRQGRLYKTGDLVRYEPNNSGSIEFVGRKDQQVKLRGQRVELTEVEYHLRGCLPPGIRVAAEVIKSGISSVPTLVAFLAEPSGTSVGAATDFEVVTPSEELGSALQSVDQTMGAKVPRYMIPAAFITLRSMPALVSGKTDRKKLREIGASIPREKIAGTQNSDSPGQDEPESENEKLLAKAWERVLGPDTKVYRETNFFSVGGDSLRAMRLVAAARNEGITLTVADIFTYPSLEAMASQAATASEASQLDMPPFSLLSDGWDAESARQETARLCEVDAGLVEDVYPCSPLQEALMALSAKVKEAYVAQRVVDLPDIETAERLIDAFDKAQQGCPILRTRIVQVPQRGLVQVVLKGKLNYYSGTCLNAYLLSDRDELMDLGTPLVRYAVINDAESGKVSFVLTMHHALYDGWGMPLVVDRVNNAYQGKETARPADFKHFIQYLSQMDRAVSESYWREQLEGATGPQFPEAPFPGYQAQADSLLEEYIPLEQAANSKSTIATVIRAAWAYVAAQYVGSEDIVFGETLTGRNAPIVGAEQIEGPMITTVPVRIHVDGDASIEEYLQTVQDQTVSHIPHEHFGLQHVRRVSPDAMEACELKTGLVLHPNTDSEPMPDEHLPASRLVPAGDSEAAQEALKFNTYSLMLVCSIDPNGFLVMASFDSKTISSAMMQRALVHFKSTAQTLCSKPTSRVRDMAIYADEDLESLKTIISTAQYQPELGAYQDVAAAYIVDLKTQSKLVPIGAVGELVLQTEMEMDLDELATPAWLGQLGDVDVASKRSERRFYKTKRLAKYSEEGQIQFMTRNAVVQATNGTTTGAAMKKVSASSRRQKKLRGLWSRVLRIAEEEIGLNDSFFLLGGDSIAAMKLVSEARLDGIKLTVVQMFQKRTLYDMASVMQEKAMVMDEESKQAPPFALLNLDDTTGFVESVVRPQLGDHTWQILNVLPTRPLQQIAVKGTVQLPRFSARYELMYFDEPVDKDRLRKACDELVSRNEILRTVFVENLSQGYAVVLAGIKTDFVLVDYEKDSRVGIEEYTRSLCRADADGSDMRLGGSFVKWFLVQSYTGESCLVFRISHAQYDEICLPILLNQLSALYEHREVHESVPFSSYVGHLLRHSIPSSTSYWKDLLAGSSMTILKPDVSADRTNHFAIEQAVDISTRSKDVTIATLPTAAWALCLARRLSARDVTFGEVVSGRNIDFANADTVTGPCWQYVPVRVKFDPSWKVADLLAHVQHQHAESSAHEGMALSEIMARCTDWPTDTTPDWFDSVVHQDVAHVETLPFASAKCRTETLYVHEEPLREWKIQAFIDGDTMTLEIVTIESWADYAKNLLADLVQVTELLVSRPQGELFT